MNDPWSVLKCHWDACAREQVDHRLPSEKPILEAMASEYRKLESMGWSDIIYCPKDGTHFLSISAGCTGVHVCYYDGKWPNGRLWVLDSGDMWPAHPILWKPMPGGGK